MGWVGTEAAAERKPVVRHNLFCSVSSRPYPCPPSRPLSAAPPPAISTGAEHRLPRAAQSMSGVVLSQHVAAPAYLRGGSVTGMVSVGVVFPNGGCVFECDTEPEADASGKRKSVVQHTSRYRVTCAQHNTDRNTYGLLRHPAQGVHSSGLHYDEHAHHASSPPSPLPPPSPIHTACAV